MAADARPPIFDMAVQGWRYAFAALSRMPVVLGVAMLIVFALSVAKRWLLPDVENLLQQAEATGELDVSQFIEFFQVNQIVGPLFMTARSFLLTPAVIAMHRFVLLGESAQRYALTPSQPRFMRFFLFSTAFQILIAVPYWFISLVVTAGPSDSGFLAFMAWATAYFLLLIVIIIVSLRSLILFPAIAVDAPGTNWRNAMADTRGHTWRVFFIALLTAIPVLVLAGLLHFLLGWLHASFTSGIVRSAVQSVISVLMLCAFAAIASRLFAAFSNKLNG